MSCNDCARSEVFASFYAPKTSGLHFLVLDMQNYEVSQTMDSGRTAQSSNIARWSPGAMLTALASLDRARWTYSATLRQMCTGRVSRE